ncbi:GNAT family N-acetyltransferase [Clostridium perfringens]
MEFKIINNYDELCLLKREWDNLVDNIDNPQVFYKFSWIKAYLDKIDFKLKNNLKIILVYVKKELIAIFPFALDDKILRFITNKTVDYNNIYVRNDINKYNLIEKTIDYIYKKINFDGIELNNISGESELYIFIDILRNKKNQKVILEDSVMAPVLVNSENSKKKFRNKQLKDIDRRKRKLEKENNLSIEIGCDIDSILWKFICENHKKKWDNSVFNIKEYVDFYKEIICVMKDNIEASKLMINGKIVAAHFGFKDERKIYYYIPTYKEEFSSNAVGYILLKEIIDTYSDKDEFDFLRGNELYKFNWTDTVKMNFNLYSYKLNIKNLINYQKVYLKKSKFLRRILNK